MNNKDMESRVPQITRLNHPVKCNVDDILWQALQDYSRTRCMCMADICRLALFTLVSRVNLYKPALEAVFQVDE